MFCKIGNQQDLLDTVNNCLIFYRKTLTDYFTEKFNLTLIMQKCFHITAFSI